MRTLLTSRSFLSSVAALCLLLAGHASAAPPPHGGQKWSMPDAASDTEDLFGATNPDSVVARAADIRRVTARSTEGGFVIFVKVAELSTDPAIVDGSWAVTAVGDRKTAGLSLSIDNDESTFDCSTCGTRFSQVTGSESTDVIRFVFSWKCITPRRSTKPVRLVEVTVSTSVEDATVPAGTNGRANARDESTSNKSLY